MYKVGLYQIVFLVEARARDMGKSLTIFLLWRQDGLRFSIDAFDVGGRRMISLVDLKYLSGKRRLLSVSCFAAKLMVQAQHGHPRMPLR